MLDTVGSSTGVQNSIPERPRPELAINAPDPVLGQPVEQKLKIDEGALRERTDELSLSGEANTVEVKRGTRQNEALVTLQQSAQDLAQSLLKRAENFRQAEVITPEGSVANFSAVQPTLDVVRQQLTEVVSEESAVYNDLYNKEGTFFANGAPELTETDQGEEVTLEALAKVEEFISNVSEKITSNRTAVVNVGNQAAEQENRIEPLGNAQQVQQVQREAVQQIRNREADAVEAQANLSTGTLLELYNS